MGGTGGDQGPICKSSGREWYAILGKLSILFRYFKIKMLMLFLSFISKAQGEAFIFIYYYFLLQINCVLVKKKKTFTGYQVT